jgi:hypothetical protein
MPLLNPAELWVKACVLAGITPQEVRDTPLASWPAMASSMRWSLVCPGVDAVPAPTLPDSIERIARMLEEQGS